MHEVNPIGALSFRSAAIMICITCLFYTTVMRSSSKRKPRSRLFLVAVSIILLDCLTGVINSFVMDSSLSYAAKHIIVYINKMIYYSTHFAFVPVFAIYIIMVCDVFHRYKNKVKMSLLLGPSLFLELAVLTNPFTGFIFSNDDTDYFSRGNGVYVAYFISALYLAFCFYLLGKYWHTMNHLQKIAMFYFLALAVTGVIIQMIFPDIICELLAESLGLMGIMIMIEKDDYRLDYKTHANNRTALIHDLKSYITVGRSFYVICIRITNAEIYRRVMGYESYDLIMAKIADFLKEINYRFEVYRTTGGNFFMLCPEVSEMKINDILDRIEWRFGQSFELGNGSTNVKAKVICAKCPEEFNDEYDILRLSEAKIGDVNKMVLRGKDIDFLLRRIDVEKAIINGMNDDNFKVKYHPVYSRESMRITSAEALLTLTDPVLGNVKFAEFMSVAEDTGFVEELEYRMIEAVCKFINTGVIKCEMDIQVFVIHIMSVHVLKQELVDRVKDYISQYVVDPLMIRFSISDTIASQAQDVLGNLIDEFAKIGVRFMLLNHDSGFLGLDPSTVDKFDGVNIDVKRHFETADSNQSDIILKNRTNMVTQLGKRVIFSGIDTKELYDRVKDIPADFILGDYLSPMVTKNELQTKFWNKEVLNEKGT